MTVYGMTEACFQGMVYWILRDWDKGDYYSLDAFMRSVDSERVALGIPSIFD